MCYSAVSIVWGFLEGGGNTFIIYSEEDKECVI